MNHTTRPHLWRSRWAAIGAAVAVTLGAGGLYTGYADSPASNFVAVSPVRVLDTRLAAMGPTLVSAIPRLLDVTGAIPTVGADGTTIAKATVVPDGATAIVANVTIVSPTTPGFVSVRPGTAAGAPTTSSLNATSPGVVQPNSVTVELPTAGATAGNVQLWFQGTSANANTHLLVDIVGYYRATTAPAASGMTVAATFRSTARTGIGPDFPPDAPAGFTVTADLSAGRYHVNGALTVTNDDTVSNGSFTCGLFANDALVSTASLQEIGPKDGYGGWVSLPIAVTFDKATSGSTTISYRCARNGLVAAYYAYLDLTVFEVD